MFQFHLLAFELSTVSFSIFDSFFLEAVVVALVVFQLLVEEMDGLIASDIQELSGMGYDNYCIFAVADVILKPHHSIKVQVVCWLVQ